MASLRFAAGGLAALLMMAASVSWGVSAGQAAVDPAYRDLAQIQILIQEARDRMSLSDYFGTVSSLASAMAVLKPKSATNELSRGEAVAMLKVHELVTTVQDALLAALDAETVRMEKAVGDMSRIEAGSLKKMETLLRDLAPAGGKPDDYVYPATRALRDAIGLASQQSVFLLTPQEKEERLRGEARIRSAADRACGAKDVAAAERHVRDAEKEAEQLARTAASAVPWRELRRKDADENGLSDSVLREVRRTLDRLQDELPRLEEAAGWASGMKAQFEEDRLRMLRLAADAAGSQGKAVWHHQTLVLSMKIDEPANLRRRAESRLARTKAVGLRKRDSEASLARVAEGLNRPVVKDAARWFKDADVYVQGLRAGLDELEARVDSADRFAASIGTGLESGSNDLDRARACLRALDFRIRMSDASPAATAPSPQDAVRTGAGTSIDPLPDPPRTGVPAATAPQVDTPVTPASAPVMPAVLADVFGGIRIQGGAARIAVGQSVTFVATDMGNRMYTGVLWNSHNEELLSLGQDGKATGLKPGRLKIQAKTTEHTDAIAYLDIEVVEATSTSSDRPSGPATGPVTADPVAGGAAASAADQSGDARRETTGAPGGFGDRGLVIDPRGETRTGAGGRDADISLLGRTTSGTAAAERAGPSSGSTGFGDKGLDTRAGTDRSAPLAPGVRQSATVRTAPGVSPLEFQGGPQPAAWHIFATGSRLGWSAAYGRFTDGPADQDIIDHLIMAGEHAMWANRESYPPYRAWPNWSEIKVRFRTWAEQLVRDREPGKPREQLALSISSYAGSMAEQVTFQVIGERATIPNCDGAYMRLGFHLAFGHTALQLAEGALRAGQPRLSASAREGALDHLRQAARVLSDYERIAVVSGSCADLRAVRAEVEALLRRADLGAQVAMAGNAWTTASERIRALADLTARARPETRPAARPETPSTRARTDPQGATSAGVLWADPGELEGTWVTTLARYRFEKHGNDYVGKLERIFSPTTQSFEDAPSLHLARQGYKEGDIVIRATRTGPNAYRGTFQNRLAFRPSHTDPVRLVNHAVSVELLALGDHLDIRSADIRVDIGTTYEVWISGIREGGVEKLPTDFGEFNEQLRSLFDQVGNAVIWLCASRPGPDGVSRSVVFQDLSQSVSRDYTRMGGLSVPLTSSAPRFKPLQVYVNSSVGLRRRLEEAGYAITFGPTSRHSCVNQIRAR